MERISTDPFLRFNPNTLEDVRKCWELDTRKVNQSVDILEHWLSKQNHFVNKKFNREYLEATLVACKGSVEKAKSQIDKLCTLKTLLPKYFIDCDVRKTLGFLKDIAFIIPLPHVTEDNCRPILSQIKIKDYKNTPYLDFYRLIVVLAEYLKAHDYVNGLLIVHDLRDINLMEILVTISIQEFQQLVTLMIEGYGARLKGIHILSDSTFIDVFVKTFTPILSRKLVDRIFVHKDLEELYKVVDRKLLPEEYGGEVGSIEKLQNEWLDVISSEENETYLAEMKASCTDETMRSSDQYNEQAMGLPGSFRTLNVD